MNRGIMAAVGAYGLWGILPIYWKLLQRIPAIEILFHRMIWSLVFLLLLLALRDQWDWIHQVRRNRRVVLTFAGSGLLLGLNWYTYIYAVNSGHIVEASLGYYINPLLNVVLGVVVLRESLRRIRWIAVAIAAAGVLYLTLRYGQIPWISLTLASTFAIYGLIRKTASLGSLTGLSLEMLLLSAPAIGFLALLEFSGTGHFGHTSIPLNLLLAMTGIATALPLLLFAYGAQRIMLSTIGILQYIAPTLQFLIGVFLYQERFPAHKLIGFSCVWIALAIYTFDEIQLQRQRRGAETIAAG